MNQYKKRGEIIKKMAVGANDANAPTSVLFGTVTGINPLEITVEQKLKLTKEFLVNVLCQVQEASLYSYFYESSSFFKIMNGYNLVMCF